VTANSSEPLAELSDALVDLLAALRRVAEAAAQVMDDPLAREQISALVTTLIQAATQNEPAE